MLRFYIPRFFSPHHNLTKNVLRLHSILVTFRLKRRYIFLGIIIVNGDLVGNSGSSPGLENVLKRLAVAAQVVGRLG